ncbi:Fic family protein [Bradyrhizobium sp. UFLA06-06]
MTLNETDKAILDAIETGANTASGILAALERNGISISQPTLSRRLSALQADRYVLVEGKGRNTRYKADNYNQYFSIPPERRKAVSYDRSILENYVPNQTRWLDPEVSQQLLAAGGGVRADASTYSRAIVQKLLVDLSYASSSLEGNTYSYLDTQVLIEYGQAAEGKAADETQMILNHKEAITYLVDNIGDIELDVREIRNVHSLLSRGLIDPAARGTVRRRIVGLGNSAYTPLAIPQILEDQLTLIVQKQALIDDPFERSLFLMVMISYLQYFEDVNKRTGRVICNVPLLKAGLAPLSFMNVDKTKYTKGLLAFYELGRHDLITEAYAEGYAASASRYDAYVGRDREEAELEFKRRTEIYEAVKQYVLKSIEQGARLDAQEFLSAQFEKDVGKTKQTLMRRTKDIVESLNEGNHVAYGIDRKTFDTYDKLGAARKSTP